ncbi:NIPA-like protein 2 isoform X1 [Pungitius pungitius]|uniref:NIPA-like protein 2 isoform X1 n=1 Tax=Pungitius pungitius TaxID=134920 RepID=UPI002E15C7B0
MSVLNDTENMANATASQPTLNASSPWAHRAEILENPLRTYLLGIIISICGNILISISLNIQKYAHVRHSQRDSKPYYTSPVWWCGVALMGVGELGNFAAYGFAPASLIAPLGCVSVIDDGHGYWVTPLLDGKAVWMQVDTAAAVSSVYEVVYRENLHHLAPQPTKITLKTYTASAVISVIFLKETVRVSDVLGGTLAITGTYVLVTFAPHTTTHITAHLIQYYIVSWFFVLYLSLEVLLFCILLYVYKKRNVKHIVVVMLLVALLASLTVISVKAVSGMITESIKGQLQFIYPIFYVMLVIMIASCAFQIKFLNQAMKMFDATEVVPINFVFFTASAIVAGIVFYQEFEGLALLNIFMFLLGCLLSFLGVFLIARNRPKIKQQDPDFIALDKIPSRSHTDKVQPEANTQTYGSLAAKLMCNSASRTHHDS